MFSAVLKYTMIVLLGTRNNYGDLYKLNRVFIHQNDNETMCV